MAEYFRKIKGLTIELVAVDVTLADDKCLRISLWALAPIMIHLLPR
jgi:hypothetical protein